MFLQCLLERFGLGSTAELFHEQDLYTVEVSNALLL